MGAIELYRIAKSRCYPLFPLMFRFVRNAIDNHSHLRLNDHQASKLLKLCTSASATPLLTSKSARPQSPV